MNKLIKLGCIIIVGTTFAACSTVVKAPCGPTAGLTDPCGNAKPINKHMQQDSLELTALDFEIVI